MTMSPRQRVLATFRHEQTDRVPIELGTTRASGIHVEAYRKLLAYIGQLPANETVVKFSQVTLPVENILERFRVDCRPIMLGAPLLTGDVELENGVWQDEWGVQRIKPEDSFYYDIIHSPLGDENLNISDLNNYPWPDPEDPGRSEGVLERYKYLRERTEYAALLHLGAELGLQTQYMRGFEQWFLDLGLRREFADALLDRVLDYQLILAEKVLDALPGDVDIIYLVDDFASQDGLLISPTTYRSYLKPRQKKLIGYIKSRSDAKILMHLCGSVVDILDDLIEIGVDAINPVQLTARGMDAESLKHRFGDQLTFWGAVDGQQLLPHGKPEEVKKEVYRLIRVLGDGGGFVIGPCHNIQPDVPPENICTLYDTVLETAEDKLSEQS